jgi:hypothetical protein
MKLRTALLVAGVVFGLAASAPTAHAAKGIKKKGGETHHHGKVISVDHKGGHLTIATLHQSKKKKNVAAAKVKHLKFSVTNSTKVVVNHKKKNVASNLSAVRVGENVTIASHKGHADVIQIHLKTHKRQNVKKPRLK